MKDLSSYSVISPKLAGGPKGLGDPDDKSLRKVETDILIPKLMRERTKTEKCVSEVKEFHDCCLNSGLLNVVKCRKENEIMKSCMEKWFFNQDFIKECTEQYLNERSEFRKTGIPKKQRSTRIEASL
ncbi:COX assembly mitochondrial protein-like protein [Formica fusca]|uniref:COX assembly mitochondrial protein homolog n=1 Tax=Formica exsecta TaxID=72781 RepID=UPI0011425463|nr:COX assembly mitochondrial protein homolog [Formica exsecta]XP_029660882.1 COX assembly mitochondrial protein homolog [Formica exsecta]XP_029660883.1 COX assembly mitochondrial protein homolog [Formica exsecta]